MNLLEIRLAARDYQGIDIRTADGPNHWHLNPSFYRAQGYDGVRFIGAGVGKTRIIPDKALTATESGLSVNVGLEAGHVEFESMSFHCGPLCALRVGGPTRGRWTEPMPETPLHVVVRDFEFVADKRPADSGRAYWGIFAYQADLTLEDGDVHLAECAEHANYNHGAGKNGHVWRRVRVHSCGAEGYKNRADPSEVSPTPGATTLIESCEFRDWYQPHSHRGGAGIVFQGTGANLVVRDTVLYGSTTDPQRARCIMVDDNGSKGYWSAEAGQRDVGSANGHIILERVGMVGVGPDWYSEIARVGSLMPQPFGQLARSLTVEDCGLYGDRTLLRASAVPRINVTGCNTEAVAAKARSLGIDPAAETSLAMEGQGLRAASVGYQLGVQPAA